MTKLRTSTAEIAIIRASTLSGYADCPRRSAPKIIGPLIKAAGFDLNRKPFGIGGVIGIAVHDGAAMMLKEKATSDTLPSLDDVENRAVESIRKGVEVGTTYDREAPDLNIAESQVRRMAREYRASIAPDVRPILVEERLEANYSPGIIVTGQADVVAREPGAVRDTKTGKRRGNHKPQIGTYSLLARSNGIPIHAAKEDFIQRVGIKKPQPPGQVFDHDIASCETAAVNVLRHIEGDIKTFVEGDEARRIKPGDPWAFMANPSSMLCGAKYCEAFGTQWCTEHRAEEKDEE